MIGCTYTIGGAAQCITIWAAVLQFYHSYRSIGMTKIMEGNAQRFVLLLQVRLEVYRHGFPPIRSSSSWFCKRAYRTASPYPVLGYKKTAEKAVWGIKAGCSATNFYPADGGILCILTRQADVARQLAQPTVVLICRDPLTIRFYGESCQVGIGNEIPPNHTLDRC